MQVACFVCTRFVQHPRGHADFFGARIRTICKVGIKPFHQLIILITYGVEDAGKHSLRVHTVTPDGTVEKNREPLPFVLKAKESQWWGAMPLDMKLPDGPYRFEIYLGRKRKPSAWCAFDVDES